MKTALAEPMKIFAGPGSIESDIVHACILTFCIRVSSENLLIIYGCTILISSDWDIIYNTSLKKPISFLQENIA